MAIFPKLCLWRRSLCSNLGGIGLEKLYRATLPAVPILLNFVTPFTVNARLTDTSLLWTVLLCPWGKVSLKSTRLIQTPC